MRNGGPLQFQFSLTIITVQTTVRRVPMDSPGKITFPPWRYGAAAFAIVPAIRGANEKLQTQKPLTPTEARKGMKVQIKLRPRSGERKNAGKPR